MTVLEVMAAKDLTSVSSSALEAALQDISVMVNGAAANNTALPDEIARMSDAIHAELQRRRNHPG